MTLLQVKVKAKRVEAQDVCSFELVSADERVSLPSFTPGAHVDVHVPGGWIRQYSLWNDPAEEGVYRIGVLKEAAGRGGSRSMHESVEVGTLLQIGSPRNQFELHPGGEPSLLMAGGIGITPIMSMAQSLARRGGEFELHYCTRSLARTAFLDRLASPPIQANLRHYVDDAGDERRLHIGRLLSSQAKDVHLYVCGPKGFMDAVLQTARGLHWAEERLHYEFFAAEPVRLAGDHAFQLKLARSGRVIQVAAQQTAAQALAAAGVELSTSCEQGICGTCMTPVLAGIPDHRDTYLLPEEHAANDCFTPCCSRAHSPELVIDL